MKHRVKLSRKYKLCPITTFIPYSFQNHNKKQISADLFY